MSRTTGTKPYKFLMESGKLASREGLNRFYDWLATRSDKAREVTQLPVQPYEAGIIALLFMGSLIAGVWMGEFKNKKANQKETIDRLKKVSSSCSLVAEGIMYGWLTVYQTEWGVRIESVGSAEDYELDITTLPCTLVQLKKMVRLANEATKIPYLEWLNELLKYYPYQLEYGPNELLWKDPLEGT